MQRVPPNEKSRRHTSTVTVAVLKEEDYKSIKLDKCDVDFSACRAGGNGGQNVNSRSTAVRLVHKGTGEVVECREERYQGRNRDKALKRLEYRLNNKRQQEYEQKVGAERKEQVGCGMRGDKIRTYNYRENRVTNHLTGKSVKALKDIVEGGRIDLIQ